MSSFREEVTVVQIIGNGMPQVNGTGGWKAVASGGVRAACIGLFMPASALAGYFALAKHPGKRTVVLAKKGPQG